LDEIWTLDEQRWEGIMDAEGGAFNHFLMVMLDQQTYVGFRLEFINAAMVACNWFRVVIMLKLQLSFGPMLTIF
jgi:hypothetical protein